MEYAIGNYAPEEISVKTEGHTLRVHALRDKNEGGHREHKEFKRDCTIPGTSQIVLLSKDDRVKKKPAVM